MSDFYDIKDLQKSSYFDLITSTTIAFAEVIPKY